MLQVKCELRLTATTVLATLPGEHFLKGKLLEETKPGQYLESGMKVISVNANMIKSPPLAFK